MNPALPLVILAASAFWWLGSRRSPGEEGVRSIGRSLRESLCGGALAGFAGILLLWPAFSMPRGIPSPAADIAAVAPWQADGERGNPTLRDVTFQIEPWLVYTREELRAGRLPFWNPYQSAGSPFWSAGQPAPLFPLHLLFVALPLPLGFVLLPWLRLVVGGAGAWALARELGLSRFAAAVVAVGFPLSGMFVSFLSFPMGNALALVPWVFWAVERLARGSSGALPLAVAAGLQLLGGHPETSAHTAFLTVVYLAGRLDFRGTREGRSPIAPTARSPLRVLGLFVSGWLLAAALAAVQIFPLAHLLPETARWLAEPSSARPPLALLAAQPLRFVLPELYGHPARGTWWGPFNYSATAVYVGALTLPLLAIGLVGARRDRRLRGLAFVLAICFLGAYHWPGFRALFDALPILGKAAHHRLIFGLELGLLIFAAAGLDRLFDLRHSARLRGPFWAALFGTILVVILLAVAWGAFGSEWRARGLDAGQAAWTARLLFAAVAVVGAAWKAPRLGTRGRLVFAASVPALLALDLTTTHAAIHPGLAIERLFPSTGAIEFLKEQPLGRVAAVGDALRPNLAMAYRLRDLRGEDPAKTNRFERAYAAIAQPDPAYFRPIERWDAPALDAWGVRWVLAGPNEEMPPTERVPATSGWHLKYQGPDARVWERPTSLPLVRWEATGHAEGIEVVAADPGVWRLRVESPQGGVLWIAETWDAGWSATLDGRRVEVLPRSEQTALGVAVGSGRKEVELRYVPVGFRAGATVSLLAWTAIGFLGWRRGRPEIRRHAERPR